MHISDHTLAGVIISIAGGGVQEVVETNASGEFTLKVPAGWSGTLTPGKDGYSFILQTLVLESMQADLAGQHFTANTIVTGIAPEKDVARMKLYPNPVRDVVKIALSQPLKQQGSLVVTDVAGKVVWQAAVPKGSNQLFWPVTSQPGVVVVPGVYQLRLWEADKLLASDKVLVIR